MISGVSPQLQNSSNCIVAAIANVLWYYGSHGYAYLTNGMTFYSLKNSIDTLMKSSSLFDNPGYRNVNVPKTIYNYVKSKNRYYSSVSSVISNPTINTVIAQIDAGKPCMVGFAAGSTYSSSVGHMTACFGYQYIGGAYQVALADGHSSSIVYKTWTKYNDCVITVTLSK